MEFKHILKGLIVEKGCTQRELAEYVGVKPNTVCDWIRKGTSPKVEHIKRIATFFDISYDYLFTGNFDDVSRLSNDEKAMLKLYRKLSKDERLKQIGRLETLFDIQEEKQAEETFLKEKNVG